MPDHSPESPKADTLADAARSILTSCRECRDERDFYDDPVPPADFIVWGKLAEPEALGPKCYDHAVKHLGHSMPGRADQYAVVDLRPIRAALTAHDQQGEPARMMQSVWPKTAGEDTVDLARVSDTPEPPAGDDHMCICSKHQRGHIACDPSCPCWHADLATPEGGEPVFTTDPNSGQLEDNRPYLAPKGEELEDLLAAADATMPRSDNDARLIGKLASALRRHLIGHKRWMDKATRLERAGSA